MVKSKTRAHAQQWRHHLMVNIDDVLMDYSIITFNCLDNASNVIDGAPQPAGDGNDLSSQDNSVDTSSSSSDSSTEQ